MCGLGKRMAWLWCCVAAIVAEQERVLRCGAQQPEDPFDAATHALTETQWSARTCGTGSTSGRELCTDGLFVLAAGIVPLVAEG